MNRALAALSLALLAAGLTTACAPTSSDIEERVLGTVAAGSTLTVTDLLPEEGAKRFTVACPYETPADVAARLDVDTKAVPDLSDRDDAQALVVVTGRDRRERVPARSGRLLLDGRRMAGLPGRRRRHACRDAERRRRLRRDPLTYFTSGRMVVNPPSTGIT
ncbi:MULTISPECIES: hypothetical protein [Microbacterium]|uniref:hypothetical protein n=1 Tax=Microbacterium TaxID=33882 RepID=UPI00344E15C1